MTAIKVLHKATQMTDIFVSWMVESIPSGTKSIAELTRVSTARRVR